MNALLELAGVDKTFHTERGPVHAVRGVSMAVDAGEVVGLVGESGSGKSTIANLVLGLEQPDAGEIRFRDRPVRDWLDSHSGSYRQAVQAVFQYPFQALDSRKRVGWLVAEPLVIHRRGTSRSRAERVRELMADVHLDPSLVDRFPHQLSGGQAQRVNIARALALEPSLLVCDEPVSALDVSVQAQILNLLLEINRERSMAMLFISHSLPVVRHLSHRIVVMYAGTAVERGPAEEVSDRPTHPYTQLLISAAAMGGDDRQWERTTMREAVPDVGCRFTPRCPIAIDRCSGEEPILEELREGHSSRCWRAREFLKPTRDNPKDG